LLWSTREFGFPASFRCLRAVFQASCRRSATPSRWSTRASWPAARWAKRRRSCYAPTTPLSATSTTAKTLSSPWSSPCSPTPARALRLLAGLLATAQVDRDHLARRAAADFLTVTELADSLVRHTGMSFREAHALVARAVEASGADDRPAAIAAVFLRQNPSLNVEPGVCRARSRPRKLRPPIRQVPGGPAPDVVAQALSRAGAAQREIEAWIRSKRDLLDAARRENRR